MARDQTEKLHKGGLIKTEADAVPEDYAEVFERLTDNEVNLLIRLKAELDAKQQKPGAKPYGSDAGGFVVPL